MALPTGAGCTCSPLQTMNTLGALPHLYSVREAEQAGMSVVPVDRRTMGSPKSTVLRRMPEKAPIGAGVLERIGKTPLLRLERVGREFPGVGFYAKAEWFNPGGSVKALAGPHRPICRPGAPPQGVQSRHPLHQPAARLGLPRTRRLEAHGLGHRAE